MKGARQRAAPVHQVVPIGMSLSCSRCSAIEDSSDHEAGPYSVFRSPFGSDAWYSWNSLADECSVPSCCEKNVDSRWTDAEFQRVSRLIALTEDERLKLDLP